ncbi:ATP-binding protein [Streptomyces sp. NPDC059255]|uniref:ATP-binding protein n=1 Tax=Streptomyces sp. NPDC059255 TaxID=3346793 RepID=UPI0036C87B6F
MQQKPSDSTSSATPLPAVPGLGSSSWLISPGTSPGRFATAAASGAEVSLLNLKDSVPRPFKEDGLARFVPQRRCSAFEVVFAPDRARVAHMRRIVMANLRWWNVTEPLAEEVVLAVSELVTNAVRHGAGAVGLRVKCAEDLRVEVADGSPVPATLHCAGEADESGRGLFIVAVLAQDWGVSSDGTTTWCEFSLSEGSP